MDDLALAQPEDRDLVDPLEAAPSRPMTEPFPQMGGRAGEPADDLVAFGDQLDKRLATGSPMRASAERARNAGSARRWSAPGFHLLLCGPLGDWHASQLTALRHRYPDTLAVHHLTREATPGALHDLDGQALARLAVDGIAQYLIRPDGHIGDHCGTGDLAGLQRDLIRWLPNDQPDQANAPRRSHQAMVPTSAGVMPLPALGITDDASPIRSTLDL
jgi:hypothetical protein